jgi:hypothetical protein
MPCLTPPYETDAKSIESKILKLNHYRITVPGVDANPGTVSALSSLRKR